jgi:hypothetical protein
MEIVYNLNETEVAETRNSYRPESGACPFGHANGVLKWAADGLLCYAGKREMKLGRYEIAHPESGAEFRTQLDQFAEAATAHRKTGFLAVFKQPETAAASTVMDEVAFLAEILAGAGLAESCEAVFRGDEIVTPVAMRCPVTDKPEVYSFFPVAFCRNASNPEDPLYDPSLSAPFTAINTTSDAFAFAMFVADRSRVRFGKAPHGIDDPIEVAALFDWAVAAWQAMSVNTIRSFSRVAVRAERAVSLDGAQHNWFAPHRDPSFAEADKAMHGHDMPVIYARALTDIWFATLFGGEARRVDREGQAGGLPV